LEAGDHGAVDLGIRAILFDRVSHLLVGRFVDWQRRRAAAAAAAVRADCRAILVGLACLLLLGGRRWVGTRIDRQGTNIPGFDTLANLVDAFRDLRVNHGRAEDGTAGAGTWADKVGASPEGLQDGILGGDVHSNWLAATAAGVINLCTVIIHLAG